MKNNKFTKILALLLSCLFIMGAFGGMVAFADEEMGGAEENSPAVTIKYKNIAYEDAIKLIYYVDSSNIGEGQSVKLVISNSPIENVVIDDTTVLRSPVGKLSVGAGADAVEYDAFVSADIAPSDLRLNLYAVAVVIDGENNVLAQSDVVEYSVFKYCMDRVEKGVTADQKELYTTMLDFGASVQKVLGYTNENIDQLGGWANAYYGVKVDSCVDGEVKESAKYYFTESDLRTTKKLPVNKFISSNNSMYVFSNVKGESGMTVSADGNSVDVTVIGKVGFATVSCGYTPGLEYASFEDGKLPSFITAAKFGTAIADDANSGIGEWVVNEDDGNSYLHVEKRLVGETNNFRFVMSKLQKEEYNSYTLDYSFRWVGGSKYPADTTGVMIIKYFNDSGDQIASFQPTPTGDGPDLQFGNVTVAADEWVDMTLEVVQTKTGVWDMTFYINGQEAKKVGNLKSAEIPAILFETRYGNNYALSLEFDNFFVTAK